VATDARGHTNLGSGETPSRAGLNAMILSVNDLINVTNNTTRLALPAALTSAGTPATAAKPIAVRQQDTAQYWEYNGTRWLPLTSPGLGMSWYSDRHVGSPGFTPFAFGSFVSMNTLAIDATAPAGRYHVIGNLNVGLSSSANSTGSLRLLWGATNLTNDQRADLIGGAPINIGVDCIYTWTGGAATIDMQFLSGSVQGQCGGEGTRLMAIYLGV
jgi:hypothetical protein